MDRVHSNRSTTEANVKRLVEETCHLIELGNLCQQLTSVVGLLTHRTTYQSRLSDKMYYFVDKACHQYVL